MLIKRKYARVPMLSRVSGNGKSAPKKPPEGAISITAYGWEMLAAIIEKKPGPNEALLRATSALEKLVK